MSTSNDASISEREEHNALLDKSIKWIDKYKQNLFKAYAFLWGNCTISIQQKLAGIKDFEKYIYNDQIKLLITIKEFSLNFQESRYKMSIVTKVIRAFIKNKQLEAESLQDYTRRHKISKVIMESHLGGPLILKKLSKEYQDDT